VLNSDIQSFDPVVPAGWMRRNRRILGGLAAAALLLAAGGSCASLKTENFVPKQIAPAGNDRRMEGSVNVQADVPPVSRSKVALYRSGALKEALEKAIAQKALFDRIAQGDADFVLDVWVDDAIRHLETFGEGYIIDVTAVWRLTRVKGGNEIVCDDVNGHGASHATGTNAYVEAMETATRRMIENGLSLLSERSAQTPAKCIAYDWPSMGPAVPQGHARMRASWSKLRDGLSEDEVRKLIPSMTYASRNTTYFSAKGQGGVISFPAVVFEERFYRLTFVGGRLERWELRK
jgi:hypothetical protein